MQLSAGWIPWGMDADTFGAWGQWAGAIASAAAVIVALAIAIRDARARTSERADRERAQARTVTVDVRKLNRAGSSHPALPFHVGWTALIVENHGTLPVTEITLTRLVATVEGKQTEWDLRFDNAGISSSALPYRLGRVLGPGEMGDYGSLVEPLDDETSRSVDPGEVFAEVTFVDAEGLRWSRTTENREPQRIIEK
ncbi:hypothetical protein ABZ215_13600 [Amycolatopsis sp. NPDC006131]|uniref:hypothetical protein n=1 Tax=Amycolatopsis sp. NPDC006131 TaxID=3156731 RepID=UPI0033A3FAAB